MAAKWRGYCDRNTGSVLGAFEIRDVQSLIGGGAELLGKGGESLVVTADFVGAWKPEDGDFLVRNQEGLLAVWTKLPAALDEYPA